MLVLPGQVCHSSPSHRVSPCVIGQQVLGCQDLAAEAIPLWKATSRGSLSKFSRDALQLLLQLACTTACLTLHDHSQQDRHKSFPQALYGWLLCPLAVPAEGKP